jgi:macrolide-specific efflux system membrane fusion protein
MPARLSLRRPSVAVNALLGVALFAGAWWAYETVQSPTSGTAAAAATRTVPVQQGTVTQTVTATGAVQSAGTASASFVTGGTVTAIDVKVGDLVKKGQVLAKVDPAAAQRTLAAAKADLSAANDSVTRAKAAGSDTSTAENAVTQAQLSVDAAEAAVTGTVLKAPAAGTVTAVNGTLGSSSSGTGTSSASSSGGGQGNTGGGQGSTGGSAGTGSSSSSAGSSSSSSSAGSSSSGFIELADLTRMQVTASFAEADATKLKEKQAATVTWNALSATVQSGKVVAVDPSATTANNVVTYGVTLSLDKVPAGAKVGQTVSVSVVTGTVQNAIFVNSAAITTVGNRHSVTVLSNGQPEVRQVEIGLAGDQSTQITSGAEVGEQVVVPTASTTTGSGAGGFPGGGGFTRGGGFTGGGAQGGGLTGGGTRVGR